MGENCTGYNEKQNSEVCLFKTGLTSLTHLYETYKNLTKLSIIEQPLFSINGVQNLHTLRELWVVNCQVQVIS